MRQADPRAFRTLYDTGFRLAWAFALRSTGDPKLAEELTARSLRRAFACLERYDGSQSVGAWLLSFAEASLCELKGDACPAIEIPSRGDS